MRKSKNEQIALLSAQFLQVLNNERFNEINRHTSKEEELERICNAMKSELDVKKVIYDDVNDCGDGLYVYENQNNEIVIDYSDECGESGGRVTLSKEAFK